MINKLHSDMTAAMKNKDTFKLGVLRCIISNITSKALSQNKTIVDEFVIAELKTEVNQRKKTIELFHTKEKEGKIPRESYEEEEIKLLKEIEFINEYLPEEVSDEEIINYIKTIFNNEMNDNELMKNTMLHFKGQNIDGKKVKQIIKNTYH